MPCTTTPNTSGAIDHLDELDEAVAERLQLDREVGPGDPDQDAQDERDDDLAEEGFQEFTPSGFPSRLCGCPPTLLVRNGRAIGSHVRRVASLRASDFMVGHQLERAHHGRNGPRPRRRAPRRR